MTTALITLTLLPQTQAISLKPGQAITRSGRVLQREYLLPSKDDSGKTSAITIRGANLVVDFGGATLRGTAQNTSPDLRNGTAVIVSGSNITIKNLNVHGYKIGLIARNVNGIKLINCDFSYNWKQKLLSTLEREDSSDWMSYHRNEKDEWLRYGCGVYLRGCNNFEVQKMTCTGGQNGLMLMECNNGLVWNSDLSFLSGCGLAMYLSSDNRVMHNKIDWCVRGYSHGVYNRGQDSAGIIIYEQSNRNTFAYNSVTHGGDGFFLWAGQTTMDTGHGGCNDNLLYANDFSHAPTNGVEMTFSRNKVVNNLMDECWHGIWGGYSYDSIILGNTFRTSDEHIAIEHGMNNLIADNIFVGGGVGPNLWWNKVQDPNWGYPKHRDTRSMNNTIRGNSFVGVKTAMWIRDTQSSLISDNVIQGGERAFNFGPNVEGTVVKDNSIYKQEEPLSGISTTGNRWNTTSPPPRPNTSWNPHQPVLASANKYAVNPLKGGMDAFIKPEERRGRQYILVNEWGPHDFRSPILWPRGTEKGTGVGGANLTWKKFEVIGPPGTWKVVNSHGIQLKHSDQSSSPKFISVLPKQGGATDLLIEMEYVGEKIVTPFGKVIPKGKPYRFSYSEFFAPINWTVNWYQWQKDVSDPRTNAAAFEQILTGKPIKTENTDRLSYDWGGAIGPNMPSDYFATHSVGTFEVPPGTYLLDFVADDGIRVWLDGKLILDEWHWQPPTPYSREVKLGGKHKLEIKHFEIDGYSALKASIKPKR
ncbi:MAG: right-handed parallel beta-helix repeat-containing protein [Fimbriimonadales bacterium]